MPFSTPPQPSHKEDTTALREMADQLVGKLSALVPHLHTLHQDLTGSAAPTDTGPTATASNPYPNLPSVYDSLFLAHAIASRIEDDFASIRGKV